MNNTNRILALIGFVAILKALTSLTPQPQGTVTILHEEIEITFIEDGSAKANSETKTLALRAER